MDFNAVGEIFRQISMKICNATDGNIVFYACGHEVAPEICFEPGLAPRSNGRTTGRRDDEII